MTPSRHCAICYAPLEEGHPFFATSGVFPVPAGLRSFCAAPMHWDCYATWPARQVFASAYLQMQVVVLGLNPSCSLVWRDDDLLVAATLQATRAEVQLWFAQTGSEVRVKLVQWEAWLAAQTACPQGQH